LGVAAMDVKVLDRGRPVAAVGGIVPGGVGGHALSWPRGELTAVTALVALALILFQGAIDNPGSPPEEIGVASAGGSLCSRAS
jgi:hypothetical protein